MTQSSPNRIRPRALVVTATLALLPLAASADDFADAVAAFERGDHAAAVQVFRAGAEQDRPGAQFLSLIHI